MSRIQLDRLKNDLLELTNYMEKVKKKNNKDLLSKLKRKRDFLESRLEQVQQERTRGTSVPHTNQMPSYTMINNETGEEKEMILSLAEREEILATGEWTQKLSTAKFISQHGMTINKAGDGWKDVLGKISKNSPRNKMNT